MKHLILVLGYVKNIHFWCIKIPLKLVKAQNFPGGAHSAPPESPAAGLATLARFFFQISAPSPNLTQFLAMPLNAIKRFPSGVPARTPKSWICY